MSIHGGDIYRNDVVLDFSINVNPLGIPACVFETLYKAAAQCGIYPDIRAEKLKKAVSAMLKIPEEWLLFGNGASELFMAAVHALQPKKTVIPVPSFYGYEYAAKAAGGETLYYTMSAEQDFRLTADIKRVLVEDVDLLFLANPNNPTGHLMEKDDVKNLLHLCKERGIFVILDECFIEFTGSRSSMLSEMEAFENLILIRAFTKIFSIPGVRLGYLAAGNTMLRKKIAAQLPEWNLSCFAQEVGCACATQRDFLLNTVAYVEKERHFLEDGLRKKGYRTFPSRANFILLYSEKPCYEQLLATGILIRDCANFRGLGEGFYRVAVKSRKDNETLLEAME